MKFLSTVLFFLVICHAHEGSIEIRLRILNPWSGKPITNQTVTLIGSDGDLATTSRDQDIVKLTSVMGADGVAHYLLKRPLPAKILFDGGSGRGCGTQSQWRTEEVLHSGVVSDAKLCVPKLRQKGKFRWQDVRPNPGEVIVFSVPPPRAQW